MSIVEANFISNRQDKLIKRKSSRYSKKILTRELKNLEDWWKNETIKKRNKKNLENVKIETDNKFKKPKPINNIIEIEKKNKKNIFSNYKKYILNGRVYYNLSELLIFLKISFNIDYENFLLKDEIKQEFKVKTNEFLTDYTRIYNKSYILVADEYIDIFFKLITNFINIDLKQLLIKFDDFKQKVSEEKLNDSIDYCLSTSFVCETPIRQDESFKKKSCQYIKYKTIPKWHHYAWDMINQISNSRKSFIFSKYSDEDETNNESRKKLDIDTIILKLKLKIYNNIYEFIDDIMKMIRYSIEYMQLYNNSKNITFCRMIETRLQKQIKRLKEENKI